MPPTATQTPTPIGAIARGLLAGAVGTAAMDAFLYARHRREGGTDGPVAWETSAGLDDWDAAPAPAQVGKRTVEGLFGVELASSRARLTNNITHWAYGMLGGAQLGVVAGPLRRHRLRAVDGLPFGASVWGAGYVVLPAMKLYRPIWQYDRATLAKDLSAHLVYGLATAATLRHLSSSRTS
jgi:hypothetical protein